MLRARRRGHFVILISQRRPLWSGDVQVVWMSRTRAPGRGNDEGKSPEPGAGPAAGSPVWLGGLSQAERQGRSQRAEVRGLPCKARREPRILFWMCRLLKYLCFERIPLAPRCGQRRVEGEDQSGGRWPPGGGDGAGAAEQQRLPAFWQDSPGVCWWTGCAA